MPFGRIVPIDDHIAEVIINDSVEMDWEMLNDLHHTLENRFKPPISLLINKIHSYSYTFEAQKLIGTLNNLHKTAVVTYNQRSERATQALNQIPRPVKLNIKTFSNYEDALNWLRSE